MVKVSITVHVPVAKVWDALTRPELIKKYFFDTETDTDWKPGSPIYWRGNWQGKAYEDKGKVLEVQKDRRIAYSHWSSFSSKPDLSEHYQTITYDLRTDADGTVVTVSQSCSEQEREHCEANWKMVLDGLKKLFD